MVIKSLTKAGVPLYFKCHSSPHMFQGGSLIMLKSEWNKYHIGEQKINSTNTIELE